MSLFRKAIVIGSTGLALGVLASISTPAPAEAREGAYSLFCNSESSCLAFCEQACSFDAPAWKTTCNSVPDTLKGVAHRSDTVPIPAMTYVSAGSSARATPQVVKHLQQLDAWLAKSPRRAELGIKGVHVNSCWRAPAEDVTAECHFILAAKHIRKKWENRTPTNAKEEAEKKKGELWADPNKNALAWPGASPHSAGFACDIVVLDAESKPATACSATDTSRITSKKLDVHVASTFLDHALTNDEVGAKRLNYEMWHYEFDAPDMGCRCKGDECEKFWPPLCAGPSGCAAKKK